MYCTGCSKLSFLYTKKRCIRCQAEVLNNISVLCEFCSSTENLCSVCIKKIVKVRIKNNGSCGSCGR